MAVEKLPKNIENSDILFCYIEMKRYRYIDITRTVWWSECVNSILHHDNEAGATVYCTLLRSMRLDSYGEFDEMKRSCFVRSTNSFLVAPSISRRRESAIQNPENRGRKRSLVMQININTVATQIEEDPYLSVRQLTSDLNLSQSMVHRILKDELKVWRAWGRAVKKIDKDRFLLIGLVLSKIPESFTLSSFWKLAAFFKKKKKKKKKKNLEKMRKKILGNTTIF